MNPDLDRVDLEFALSAAPVARLLPAGLVLGAEPPQATLSGTVRAWSLVRKFFREKRLVCWSTDGVRGVGGKRCEACADRGRCTPRIRLVLDRSGGQAAQEDLQEPSTAWITLELNYTSCRNFLDYARRIRGTDGDVSRVPTKLTVVPHDTWGEVRFEVDADLFTARDSEAVPPVTSTSAPA